MRVMDDWRTEGSIDDGMSGKVFVVGNTVYVIDDYTWDYVRYWTRTKSDKVYDGVLRVDGGKTWLYTNGLYYNVPNIDFDDDDESGNASPDNWYNAWGGVDASTIIVNVETGTDEWGDEYIIGVQVDMTRLEEGYNVAPNINGFEYRIPVEAVGNSVDEVTATSVKDYEAVDMEDVYNPDNLTGEYKYLVANYKRYKKGDKIQTETVKYAYNGDEMTGSYDGEDCFVVNVMNDQIRSVGVYSDTLEVAVEMEYNGDGTLNTLNVPMENLTGIADFTYDSDLNLTEVKVNASKLRGKGLADVLCALGLAYRYEDYNSEWGMVVEDVKYVDGTVLKLGYDKNVKNFMNHTLVGISPLLQFLVQGKHAVNELVWAGHASCFMTEYSGNQYGYPTRFDGLLRISPDDFEDEIDLPVNGSVATLYKLEYVEKSK